MRLVERVVRKVVHFIVDRLCDLRRNPIRLAADDTARRVAVQKRTALFFDVLDLFLTHRAAHHVGLPQRVARQLAEDLNDLLLIQNTAVGDGQDGLQRWVLVFDQLRVILAGDEPRNRVHRARAISCNDDGEIFNGLRLQPHADARHSSRFHLEHARRSSLRQHLHDLRVVVRDSGHGKVRLRFADVGDRVVDDRNVPQTEEVHLEKAELLESRHGVLRDGCLVVCRKRHVVVDWKSRNDNARRVGRGVARHALERHGCIDEVFDARVLIVHFFEPRRHAQRLFERHMERGRNELCNHIRLRERKVERPADVPNRASGRHGAEGHDLRDMVVSVFLPHIVDNFASSRVSEVHIDIGHRHALRVQKALEEEAVFHGVDFCDVEGVRYHRARRAAAPGADRNARAFCEIHEVPHNQEVVRKAHLLDHVNFVVHLCPVLGMRVAVALLVALVAELFQVRQRVVARREFEFRQMVFAERKLDVAAFGNFRRVFDCFGIRGKELSHLLFGLYIELLRLKFQPVRIVDGLSHLDAHENVLNFRVLLPQIVRVVRRDKRQPRLL